MAGFISFTIDDTSPLVLYTPLGDTLATPNLGAGWNPYYDESGFVSTIGETGVGKSLHITSRTGSSVSLSWRGTGIQLFGNATQAEYAIQLDGEIFTRDSMIKNASQPTSDLLASIQDLQDADHTISLISLTPVDQNPPGSSMIVFDRAIIVSNSTLNINATLKPLDDRDVAFHGQWSFLNNSTMSLHQSSTKGDSARVTFNGSAIFLFGMTSPQAGQYAVTIDNKTTSFSGKSSFTATTLLYFTTGLDPNVTHSVEISNESGAKLSINAGGFSFYSSDTPTAPPTATSSNITPTTAPQEVSSVSASASFPSGTVAAFVLAGVLGFLFISGLLFYFFFYKPRRKRRRISFNPDKLMKEEEAGDVLDIGRNTGDIASDPGPRGARRDSGRSGFARWKKEVENSINVGGLGIMFRYSHSTGGKHSNESSGNATGEGAVESRSSIFTSSSAKRKRRSKGKKPQVGGQSRSPSFVVDLQLQTSSQESSSASPIDKGKLSTIPGTSSALLVTPTLAPPSYIASISNRDLTPSPARVVSTSTSRTHFSPVHEENEGLVENFRDNEVENEQVNTIPENTIRFDHHSFGYRGDIADDEVLGPSSSRMALRGLKPRTSKARNSARHSAGPIEPPSSVTPIGRTNRRGPRGPRMPREKPTDRLNFLQVRASSPFRISFNGNLLRPERNSQGSLTPDSVAPSPQDSSPEITSDQGPTTSATSQSTIKPTTTTSPVISSKHNQAQSSSRPVFRITPDFSQYPQNLSGSEGAMSFLDFAPSSVDSSHSRSNNTTISSSGRHGNWEPPNDRLQVDIGGNRWSGMTAPSVNVRTESETSGRSQQVDMDSSRARSSPSIFPIPIELSLSPSRPSGARAPRRSGRSSTSQGSELNVHPLLENLESPTESIPMSISDLHFRHSGSDDTQELWPHYPSSFSQFPGQPHSTPEPTQNHERSDSAAPALSSPAFIVQQVLGLPSHSPSASITNRHNHSRSISTTHFLNSMAPSRPENDDSDDN